MKKFLFLFVFGALLQACGHTKYAVGNSAEEKEFSSLLKKLDKSNDELLKENAKDLFYKMTVQHLDNIEMYKTLTEPDKWQKIMNEFNALLRLQSAVAKSSAARKFITPTDYTAKIQLARQDAAADYYNLGLKYLNEGDDKSSARAAYNAFSMANDFYPGYKDVKRKMDESWKLAIINVVINPVTDQSSYYAQMVPNRFGNSFNNDLLQRSLVRDLGGDYSKSSPAKFYTDREAFMANVPVDWIVDITWTNLDIPYPLTQQFSQNLSREIEVGKDTSGKARYQTVKATLYVTRKYFTARGEIECRVTDAYTRDNIDLQRFHSQVDWQQQYATYSGDERALSDYEWAMVHNVTRLPTREEILLELYNKIYPQLKNSIYNLVY